MSSFVGLSKRFLLGKLINQLSFHHLPRFYEWSFLLAFGLQLPP
jgi:hypothetical protein